jgi:hypothetical protein
LVAVGEESPEITASQEKSRRWRRDMLRLQAGVVNTMRLPAGVHTRGRFGLPRLRHPLFRPGNYFLKEPMCARQIDNFCDVQQTKMANRVCSAQNHDFVVSSRPKTQRRDNSASGLFMDLARWEDTWGKLTCVPQWPGHYWSGTRNRFRHTPL